MEHHTHPTQRGDFHQIGRRDKMVACLPILFLVLSGVTSSAAAQDDFLKHIFNAGLIPYIWEEVVYFVCAENCGLMISGGGRFQILGYFAGQ